MTGARMHAETFAVLRHIEVHGPRTRPELCKGLQQADKDLSKRVANLMMLGYLALDDSTKPAQFALTGKARIKLADKHAIHAPAPQAKPKKVQEAATRAMSAAQAARLAPRTPPRLHLNSPVARITNKAGGMTAPYRATEYSPSARPGSNDAFELPSRYGDRLRWRDGRVTDLDGNPLP